MERVTIGKLRNSLSAYLRKVKAGETVIVCDRDTPVARLAPVGPADTVETKDERVARLVVEGKLIPPKNPIGHEKLMEMLRRPPPKSRKSIVQTLIEEREEGR